jgi:hypothetical protein
MWCQDIRNMRERMAKKKGLKWRDKENPKLGFHGGEY